MIEDPVSRLRAWTDDYEAAHRDVFDVYYRSYSAPGDRDKAVAAVAEVAPVVREREIRAEALARQTEREFRALGLLDELNVVLLVGNKTANAWVDEFRGQPAMFVALELMGPPPYDGMTFSHEAVHLAHLYQGAASWPDDVGSHLVQEGVATAASRERHPGQSDSGYLWNDDQHDAWVRECREAEWALITLVLQEMATPAEASHVEGLFAPHRQAALLPPRSGYWLGDLLAQRWLSQHSLRDVLRWNHAEATGRAASDLRTRVNP